ncbi:effector of murein hydrolase LrgA [Brevibacillus panacihumi W25]|uniref:Effector of murein hydrolase LrgA n=1 Tax=Brevibacillus panacihumi W25 TaxID=1408254 RepID=V6MLN7_9BACL|nr:CidA/LrgA family protein [Brevibacillus panacihumi]EST56403.1 effector of murein hydrolase LrgA [Brevibacillus panacihumi W25]
MKIVNGILILLVFYGVGTLASKWLHIPLPGNLIGMLLLTLALYKGWIRMDWVEQASNLLIRHMLLFFVPIIAGVASYLGFFAEDPLPILLALISGPFLVMIVTGKVVQWYVNRQQNTKKPVLPQEGRSLDA